MANKFEIQVVALDKATKVFRGINKSMAQTVRPLQQAQRQFAVLGKEMHLDKISKGMRGVSAASLKVAQNLGLAGTSLESIFGLGAAGGIVAAGAALVGLGAKAGSAGFEIARTSQAIGVSTDDLQKYRGAAKLAGLSSEQLTGAFDALGRTIQNAEFGRDPVAMTMLQRFGIGIKRTKEGLVDTVGTFNALGDAIRRTGDPHVQELIANAFGIGDMLPLLRKGQDGIAGLIVEAKRLGLVMGPEQIKNAEQFGDSLNHIKAAAEGLALSWGSKLTPVLTRSMNFVSGGLSGAQTKGAGDFLGGALSFSPLGFLLNAQAQILGAGAAPGMQRASGVVTSPGGGGSTNRHNPGNLRVPGSATQFQNFETEEAGLAAMARQLGLYGSRGLNSIDSIVSTYAPSSENNTGAYISDVARRTGFDPGARLDLADPKVLAPLMSAMVNHEQGKQPFSAEQYANAAQNVKVEIALTGAPPGTRVASTGGGTLASVKISNAMQEIDGP